MSKRHLLFLVAGFLMIGASTAGAGKLPTILRYTGELSSRCATPFTAAAHLEPAIVGATVVFTLNGTDSCSGTVDGNGIVSCAITPLQPAGTYTLTATFAGDAQYQPASTMTSFTVTKLPSSVTYTGATTGTFSVPVTLAARLDPALAGAALEFALGSTEACSGTVDASGVASCDVIPGGTPGVYPLTVTFAGGSCHDASSITVPFTVTKRPTSLTYIGATSSMVGETVTASAILSPAVAGAIVVFTLATGESCSDVVDAAGVASCPIAAQTPGVHDLTASYGGNDRYLPSSTTVPFTVTRRPVQVALEYTGDLHVANLEPVRMSGELKDGSQPIAGRTVVFTLGAGATAQTCSGITDATGTAECSIGVASQPLNAAATVPIAAAFAGDAIYLPASDTAQGRLQYMTADAFGLSGRLSVLLGSVTVGPIPDLPNVRTAYHGTFSAPCLATAGASRSGLQLLSAQALCVGASTELAPGAVTSSSSIADVTISLLGVLPAIRITGIETFSRSTCSGTSGGTTIASLSVAGVNIPVPAGQSVTIPLVVGELRINEQVETANGRGRTVNAVRLHVPPLLGILGSDIILGSATSEIHNCRPAPSVLIGEYEDGGAAEADAVEPAGGCQTSGRGGALWLAALALGAVAVRRRRLLRRTR